MKLDVLFRSCSGVAAVHESARPVDVSKGRLLLTCLKTLVDSLNAALTARVLTETSLTIIDDHSDAGCLESIGALLAQLSCPHRLISLTETTGNAASLRANYEHARRHCHGLMYFVEDDYLHHPDAIALMVQAQVGASHAVGQDVIIFPCDHPDRYREPYPSVILLGSDRYWRSVMHSTGTFLVSRANFDRYWPLYDRFADYGTRPGTTEDATINQIYRETPCFAPMPSLTVHLQGNGISPLVPWQDWWRRAMRGNGP